MNGIAEEWRKIASLSAIKEALRMAVRCPLTLWSFIIQGRQKAVQSQVKHLMGYTKTNTQCLADYWQAITSKRDLYTDIKRALVASPHSNLQEAPEYLYVIMRVLRPEVVVETGVAAGISSAFILQALEDNNKGKLYSIDLPNYNLPDDLTFIPAGTQPGFAIPEGLKKRWQLRLGTSRDLLPGLLAEIGRVDIFLHDSDHTYENMLFEFVTAWDHLPQGGLLLSHDIAFNNAFRDFSRKIKRKPTELYLTGTGAIAK